MLCFCVLGYTENNLEQHFQVHNSNHKHVCDLVSLFCYLIYVSVHSCECVCVRVYPTVWECVCLYVVYICVCEFLCVCTACCQEKSAGIIINIVPSIRVVTCIRVTICFDDQNNYFEYRSIILAISSCVWSYSLV